MGRGQGSRVTERSSADDVRLKALAEARQRLSEAEALLDANEPGGREALQKAEEALTRSSSYPPPPPDATDEAEAKLRARLGDFLRSLR
jgi:hypothetical protein